MTAARGGGIKWVTDRMILGALKIWKIVGLG